MVRVLAFKCNKCGCTVKYRVQDGQTKKEVIEVLGKMNSFNCPGKHVEIEGPMKYLEVVGDIVDEDVPSQEEWMTWMSSKHGILYGNDEVQNYFEFNSFAACMTFVTNKKTGQKQVLDFDKGIDGKRYYWVS